MKKTLRQILCFLFSFLFILAFSNTHLKAATDEEINQAIQRGLVWLAAHQNSDGSWDGGDRVAYTAAAVLAFENEGHFPGGGNTYSAVVERGLDFIFRYAHIYPIGMQPHGNPDSDADGRGVSFWDNGQYRECYETGMVMQAIIASNTPNRVVTTGPCAGWTYYDVMVDVVDWAAFGQADWGNARGAWHYYANQGTADNSTAQWPVLGLVAAEQWGILAPQFVKDELNIWIDYIQNDANGGSGYDSPGNIVNISKTGGLLVEMYYAGDDKNTARAQAALGYINNHWGETPSGTWFGNKGHSYAMFGVFKGLELMEVTDIPNAPANPETPAGDWWGDYSEYIVNTQRGDGGWNGYSYWNEYLTVPWYIVILQATVFPVQVAVDLPACACDNGYNVTVNYSIERFSATGTLTLLKDNVVEVVFPINNFQGSATQIYTVNGDIPGSHVWKAVLNVTGGGVTTSAENQASINVCQTPVVSDIPDQFAPFTPIDLGNYVSMPGVTWSVSAAPAGWTVTLVGDVVTVDPGSALDPITLTFTASSKCCDNVVCTGSHDVLFTPNLPPVANAGEDQTLECVASCCTPVTLNGAGSSDPNGDAITYLWTWEGGTASGVAPTINLPKGTTTITLIVNDGKLNSEPDMVDIKIVDTTPPVITVNKKSVELWPPNHKYEEVTLSMFNIVITDLCEGQVNNGGIYITSVTSDEVEDAKGNGDGNTLQDILVVDCQKVKLRSEREGTGNGRVYTIHFSVKDASGNTGTASALVTVPHSQSGDPVIDDGVHYSVNGCGGGSVIPIEIAVSPAEQNIVSEIPENFSLAQNYPNPFNPTTTIRFSLPEKSFVTIRVCDILGKEVALLVKGNMEAGFHEVVFDGSGLPSGIYLYSMQTAESKISKKLILLK